MSEARGLGRGLDALIGAPSVAPGTADGLRRAPVGTLVPGRYQPRTHFDDDELDRLAASLRANGMMQPIVARSAPDAEGMLEIVAGERRWRAAQRAQIHDVPVIVLELDDREVLELGLIENLQRRDLGPVEEASGYRRLQQEFGQTQAGIAELAGKSRVHVANTLRLLQLPDAVRDMLDRGVLSAGHGRALLGAADPAALARRAVDEDLTVRQTEGARPPGGTSGGPAGRDAPGRRSRHPRSGEQAQRGDGPEGRDPRARRGGPARSLLQAPRTTRRHRRPPAASADGTGRLNGSSVRALPGVDDAAADVPAAPEEILQRLALAPADGALKARKVLAESLQHFEDRLAVVQVDVPPHDRILGGDAGEVPEARRRVLDDLLLGAALQVGHGADDVERDQRRQVGGQRQNPVMVLRVENVDRGAGAPPQPGDPARRPPRPFPRAA